jgi:hypothetical protein
MYRSSPIFLGLFVSLGVLVGSSALRAAEVEKELKLEERTFNGVKQLYGKLNLGTVRAGERVECNLELINGGKGAPEFSLVKSSCTCTRVKLPSGTFTDRKIASVAVDVPRAMGREMRIAYFQIFGDEVDSPVATVEIYCNIERAFLLHQMNVAFSLGDEEVSRNNLAIDLGERVSPSDLSFSELPRGLHAIITKSTTGRYLLQVEGRRSDLLKAKRFQFKVEHKPSPESSESLTEQK